MSRIRRTAFYCIRAIGGFRAARYLTRKRLRILCYHGFSVRDEHILSPYVFMRTSTFARRMGILKKRKIPVIDLGNAVRQLSLQGIQNAETVITMDDGWATNLDVLPLLRRLAFPVSIYVTTEHLDAEPTAFNLSLLHMLSDCGRASVTLSHIHPAIDGQYDLSDVRAATTRIIQAAESGMTLDERQRALPKIAELLGIDYGLFSSGRRFRFMTAAELREISSPEVSIQMHTHGHHLPTETFREFVDDLSRNQREIAGITSVTPRHFCYPSGVHSAIQVEWLQRMGIQSATTCEAGFNAAGTNPLLLNRYLDSDDVSDIEFEAEICGVREILRDIRAKLRVSG